jgi:crossover junction endodeoxyribonuclease RusA
MISFFVSGVPTPQGSARAFVVKGKPVITSANRNLVHWRRLVSDAAQGHAHMIEGPVKISVGFVLPRPKSLPKKVHWHLKKPDLDKLVRSICDSLTGIMWQDDSQVVTLSATKSYATNGQSTGVLIEIASLS